MACEVANFLLLLAEVVNPLALLLDAATACTTLLGLELLLGCWLLGLGPCVMCGGVAAP